MKTFKQLVNLLEVMTPQQHAADVYGHEVRKGTDKETAFKKAQGAEELRRQRFQNVRNVEKDLNRQHKDAQKQSWQIQQDFRDKKPVPPEDQHPLKKFIEKHGKKWMHAGKIGRDNKTYFDKTEGEEYRSADKRNRIFSMNVPSLNPDKFDTIANPPKENLEYLRRQGKVDGPEIEHMTGKTFDILRDSSKRHSRNEKSFTNFARKDPMGAYTWDPDDD